MKQIVWFFFLLMTYAPQAFACAVCGYASEESQTAFFVTTLLLTFVPLAMIAGVCIVLFLRTLRTPEDELKADPK